MSKTITIEDLQKKINQEKVKIFEFENSELHIILDNYWKNLKKDRINLSNIRDEFFYIINNNDNKNSKSFYKRFFNSKR